MREVTKEEFKLIYFKYGKTDEGWSQEHWDKLHENPRNENMKYKVKLPTSDLEVRMMIVNDYSANEYRLFFTSIEQEEAFFDNPGK